MILSKSEQKRYVTTQFHQYFNIGLKSFNNTYSHDKNSYDNVSKESILNKYDNTDINIERTEFCERVIDGDTIVLRSGERIRFVGVNTPEKDVEGYDVSKGFVEKFCLQQDIGINVDIKNPKDKYGRTLAVVIVNGKNLNEMLLKEGLAEIMYIPPSEFNPYSWNNQTAPEVNESLLSTNLVNQFINVVIPINEIYGEGFGIEPFLKYLNEDFSNIVVTAAEDFSVIYPHEAYKKTWFIRVDPVNVLSDDLTVNLTIHILPKKYNCNDDILIFKDDIGFLNRKGLELTHIPENTNYYKVHEFFEEDDKGNLILDNYQEPIRTRIINSYFQAIINNETGDRYHIDDVAYPIFDKFNHKQFKYQIYNNGWVEDAWNDIYQIFTEFDCNISAFTKNMRNLEIDSCYQYNDSSPLNAIHYTGTKDITNQAIEDRCTLIDANLDKIINDNTTNYISQFELENDNVIFPKTLTPVQVENSYIHKHTNNISIKHYKRIKYFNDRLYSEEKNIEDGEVLNYGYTVGNWKDWAQ